VHIQTTIATDNLPSRIAVLQCHFAAFTSWWTSRGRFRYPRLSCFRLTEVIAGVIQAVGIIEMNGFRVGASHIQITICVIVTIWLTVIAVAQPPWRSVCRCPRRLGGIIRPHGGSAPATPSFGPGDINDQMRIGRPITVQRCFEDFPIRFASW